MSYQIAMVILVSAKLRTCTMDWIPHLTCFISRNFDSIELKPLHLALNADSSKGYPCSAVLNALYIMIYNIIVNTICITDLLAKSIYIMQLLNYQKTINIITLQLKALFPAILQCPNTIIVECFILVVEKSSTVSMTSWSVAKCLPRNCDFSLGNRIHMGTKLGSIEDLK